MNHYVKKSLETHLFFARIMKEHAFFLQAGFVQKDTEWIKKADYFRRQFEEVLRDAVVMSNHMISETFLASEEMVTPCTLEAEKKTSRLTGISINTRVTEVQMNMKCGTHCQFDNDDVQVIHRFNERALKVINGLIEFKEKVLCCVKDCDIYTTNYLLLLEHIIREAMMYRELIEGLLKAAKGKGCIAENQDEFWNCIMMEHALFTRGMLDPSEGELINKADAFAHDFCEMIEMSSKECCKDKCDNSCKVEQCPDHTLKTTRELRDFNAAGTKGILCCEIKSIILPLLADHVTREANHYIRIQEYNHGLKKQK